MRRSAAFAVVVGAVLIWAGVATAGAQGFTASVRGEVKDANGILPGATVTLVNEETNVARDTTTNDVGQYGFPAVTPGTYTIKVALTGYKTHERKGLIVGTQQALAQDITLELGTIQESITVTGESPLIETSTASTGGRARQQGARTAARARPRGVSHGRHRAHGGRDRRHPVQPPAGSDQRVAAVARRRPAARQQLPRRRPADHRHAQPRGREPDNRGGGRSQSPGAHLRHRDGAHRRRHPQRRDEVRHEQLPRHRVLPDPARRAARAEFLPQAAERREGRPVLSSLRRRHRRSGCQRSNLLLGCGRGLPLV